MDESDGQRQPRAINAPGIILVTLAIFICVHLYRLVLSDEGAIAFLLQFAFIPARYTAPLDLSGGGFPGGVAADVWTFASYSLLHGDWGHLIINGLFMLAFGSAVARRLSVTGFVVFSLLCAVVGALFTMMAQWGEVVIVIGASAAVSGQFAAAIRLIYGRPEETALFGGDVSNRAPASLSMVFSDPRALTVLAVWTAINFLSGAGAMNLTTNSARIAWEAHLGGFLAGLLLFGVFDSVFGRHRGQASMRNPG